MKKYFSPFVILATGTISMTDSQLGELGIEVDVAAWDDFWAEAEEFVNENYPNFNVNDSSTWPSGFSLGDSDSWPILLF